MLGTTYPMKVSDALLETAKNDELAAIDMVNIWSHSMRAQNPASPLAGVSTMGTARRLMQRIAQRGPALLFHTDFSVCNNYAHGEAAAANIRCPTLLLLGQRDMMTPPKATAALKQAIGHARTVIVPAAGHALMAEQPDAVLDALYGFANEK
jgi:pimeloyl-ACP methyl ester carboxylesterase